MMLQDMLAARVVGHAIVGDTMVGSDTRLNADGLFMGRPRGARRTSVGAKDL